MTSKKRVSYHKFDKSFYVKLLDIIPFKLSREQTRNHLKEFECKELPEISGVKADEFIFSNKIPVNIIYVSYGTKDRASIVKIDIAYPLKLQPTLIWKSVAKVRANQICYKQLEGILDNKFKRCKSSGGNFYWTNNFSVVKKKVVANKDKPSIHVYVDCANTEIFPSEIEFNKWTES